MKGDFTRFTFDPKKHYNSVLMQQGRVVLDADWNEQADIQEHIRETEVLDVVGRCGSPIDSAGFRVEVKRDVLTLSAGRIYVDGILCELDENLKIEFQPKTPGRHLAYLDVWNRHITAVEDDNIREKALSGPDTTTRTKTEWRVKLIQSLESVSDRSCREASLRLKDLIDPGYSRLAARLQTAQKESVKDPCVALSGASYQGLENQLYRVEIHQPGEVGKATFKWSRDNGAVAFAIEKFISDNPEGTPTADSDVKYHKVKLSQLGWDEVLRIHKDDLIEVLGDETELSGKPGTLARVEEIDEADMILTLSADVTGHANESHPKVRRWDGGESELAKSALIERIPTEADSESDGWIELEKGVEVRFKAGDNYQTGDYWLIPARNTGKIEWPHDVNDFVPKFGIKHHCCLLAILNLTDGVWKLERDCRKLFPPLSDMVFLSYVGGDGQEAMPGNWLPAPFEVRVSRGEIPVVGAEILFEIFEGQGVLDPQGVLDHADGSAHTGTDGIARCKCRLIEKIEIVDKIDEDEQSIPNLRVRATLIDVVCPDENGDPSHPSIIFNANASVAEQVAYVPPKECLQLDDAKTVSDAINGLCRQVSFSYAGGDGQEAMPGEELSAPFSVRVSRGSYPIEGAWVKFQIDGNKGTLRSEKDEKGPVLDIPTRPDGIAICFCTLKEDATIEAKLIKPTPTDQSPIWFNANVSVAEEVAYGPPKDCLQLGGVKTVRDAINGLCRQVSFTYAGGDGQEAMPGKELLAPFSVRVSRGSYPIEGATVKFKIDDREKGKLRNEKGETGPELDIPTNSEGIATCFCSLKADATIEAKLIKPTPTDQSSIWFNANVSVAEQVAYDSTSCPKLQGALTVQAAIDSLCNILPATKSSTVWVHGNSLQVEVVKGKIVVVRENSWTSVEVQTSAQARMHFSIPTTLALDSRSSTIAQEAFIRFKVSGKDLVVAAFVYDGETLIFEFDIEGTFEDFKTIAMGPIGKSISTGLGISILVAGRGETSTIFFSAAGCSFSSK